MNNISKGQTQNAPDIRRESQHSFDFYEPGIKELTKVSLITAFLKRSGSELVAVIAILALCVIAREFIRNANEGFNSFALFGSLITVVMIFVIGLLATHRATKSKHAKDTQEKQSNKTQPGVGKKCTYEN